jgi:ArsR family transcriptional regulator
MKANERIPIEPRQAPAGTVPSSDDEDLARLAKAIGHPIRAAILRHLLRHGQCICGDLVELLPLAQSTVSQHLKVLKQAGLLQGEVDGPRVCYCADPAAVQRLEQLVGSLEPKE